MSKGKEFVIALIATWKLSKYSQILSHFFRTSIALQPYTLRLIMEIQSYVTNSTTPEPPDNAKMQIDSPSHATNPDHPSFLNKLITNTQLSPNLNNHHLQLHAIDLTDESNTTIYPDKFISITAEDKSRLYSP